MRRLRAGEPLDARNTTIGPERLDALLDALKNDEGQPVLPAADFRRATFSGDARFFDAIFRGGADFRRTTFSADARFRNTVFRGGARVHAAIFNGYADFKGATFSRDAAFDRATFSDYADFNQASFSGDATFKLATFSRAAGFDGTDVSRTASFEMASFQRSGQLGPLVVGERLVLDDCVFAERVSIEAAAAVVSARATKFVAGAQLRMRWAEIALDDADFARASTLSCATTWRQELDLPPACIADHRHIELDPCPRLITLRGAHVAELSLSNVDLRACRFFGAHGLRSLSIEASCTWPRTPSTRRYIDRETIAEEHHWRVTGRRSGDEEGHTQDSRWDDPFTQAPSWLEGRDLGTPLLPGARGDLQPSQIAALYRALRKAREDDNDQAGASDQYYGELDMRRHAAASSSRGPGRARSRSELAVLSAYWLISGYGLKASRALITLFLVVVVASLGLQAYGFTHDPPYTRALLFSIESTSSLLRAPEASGLEITYTGEGMQIALRLLGPLLIGLALLALRARVKR
jgi:uncharacterized protein YjbI with pentapeptide repeats